MKADQALNEKYDIISTTIPALDIALGIGGIPTKRIIEIAGPSASGKSTLAMQIVAQAQRENRPCLYCETEMGFGVEYATSLGVDCSKLDIIQQDEYAEKVLDGLEAWATENKGGLIILDSVGHLLPREEAEGGAEKRSIGLQARLVGSFTRRIIPILTKYNHALLIINHTFTDLNTGALKSSGGAKLEYSRSIWITLRRAYGKQPRRSSDGTKTYIPLEGEIRKNKLFASEGRKAELDFVTGQGFVGQPPEKKRPGRPKKEITPN